MTKHYNAKTMDPVNTAFLTLTPIAAIVLTWYWVATEGFDYRQVVSGVIFYILTGMSITAGYHRLFSHRAYDAHPIVKLFFLCFGAAAFQNSILKWGSDHRLHHAKVDTEHDPYNINESFFYAHMGWVMLKENAEIKDKYAKDLYADKLVMWQHKYYLIIATVFGAVIPTLIGGLFFGSYLGGFAVGAMCKIVFLHHCTFFINSLCHYWGSTPYTDSNTAKDSWYMALFTFGEGYHNFHHYFQADYRNGIRWFHFDPAKWLIKFLEFFGLAYKLKKTPEAKILNATMQMKMKELAKKKHLAQDKLVELENLKEQILVALNKWQEFKVQFKEAKQAFKDKKMDEFKSNAYEMKAKMEEAHREFKDAWAQWKMQVQSFGMTPA
jgi:stearoyl-CoA desaturase (delta-9 desaturase)